MKKLALMLLPVPLTMLAPVAQAQSSVTLYGVIDEAFQFVHNANAQGNNLYRMQGGNLQGSRWGLKGTEDLGGGLKAIFQLESGFDINSGKMGSYNGNTLLFGRQAFVGLTHQQYGTLTLGRQYDPVVDMVQPLTADNYWGSTFTTPGDVDNNDNSSRTNNAIKYLSPQFAGFQIEGMYAFGGVAGATGSQQTWSAAASYVTGPFSIAAGYVRMTNANSTIPRTGWTSTSDGTFDGGFQNLAYETAKWVGIGSVALQYVAGPWTFGGRYSNAQYKADAQSLFPSNQRYNVAGGFVNYALTPASLIGVGYTWTHSAGDTSATYNQLSLGGDYNLSKRTDVYLVGAWQHANGTQRVPTATGSILTTAVASVADYGLNGSSSSQIMVSLGIRHKF
ncbi:MAG TPA: porin [Paraburkholderia sp.]|uniref:porin n=1 Tax=Paraburkholderia sp. TaxID=1926495 RepID=UPI002B48A0A4|nr:porin [Paraburkholderia sp.]HKR44447.1 porin [Paraburkholderia sp.]